MKIRKEITYVGSRLVPWRSNLPLLKHYSHQPLFNAKDMGANELIAVHNSYAIYCVILLMSATGHRPVTDPFHSIRSFDLQRGLLLIEDKEVFPVRGPRLVWLAPMAIETMHKYLAHLDAVSRKLTLIDRRLATDIADITQASAKHHMPLFFLLAKDGEKHLIWESIMPAKIAKHLSDWKYPLNTGRHLLAESLRRYFCPAYQAEAHLGHMEAGFDIFSIESTIDANWVGVSIKPLLQDHLQKMNWEPLDGFVPSQGMYLPRHLKRGIVNSPPIGPAARAQKREANWKSISVEVDALLASHLPESKITKLSDETIDTLREKLIEYYQSKGEGMLIALVLLRRRLSGMRRGGVKIKLPGRFVVERTGRTPFDTDTLYLSTLIRNARQIFESHLSQKHDFTVETRIAEIIVSAVLWGGITDQHALICLPDALHTGLRLVDDNCSVDIQIPIGKTKQRTLRWLPDAVSLALIIGLSKKLQFDNHALNGERICAEILSHVETLGFYKVKKSKPRGKTAYKHALRNLIRAARAHWRVSLPGVLRQYVEGGYNVTPLPYWRWATLLAGRRTFVDMPEDIPVSCSSKSIPAINPSSAPGSDSWDKGELFWKQLTAAMSVGGGRSAARKDRLLEAISKCCDGHVRLMSTTAHLLTTWLIHLCQHGTPTLMLLSANTIITYGRTIGRGLLEHGSHLNLLGLNDIGFEDLYFRIVEESAREHKAYLVGRLQEFHRFLIETLGVPSIDWSEVSDSDTEIAVDAGIITVDEYEQALDLVMNDSACDERSRLANAMVLFLAFHFGLRRGEIFRLRVSDLLYNEHHMIVLVRNSVHGETKSDNGVRQIPLIGTLSPTEQGIVKRWFAHAKDPVEDNNALLLASATDSRRPMDAISRPVEALRLVTFNPQVRLRHMRHTFASRLFLSMLPHTDNGLVQQLHKRLWGNISPEQVRETLLGRKELSPRCLYAVAMVMGHGNITTTLTHYTHLLDVALHDWHLAQQYKVSDKALAYAYYVKYPYMRQLRVRKADALHSFMLARFGKELARRAPPDTAVEMAKPIPSALPGPTRAKTNMRMSDTDRLVTLLGIRTTLDGLADRFLVTEEQVLSLQTIASNLQRETGFVDFGLPFDGADLWVKPTVLRDALLDKEASRARQHLDSLDAKTSDRDLSVSMAKIWKQTFQSNSRALLIEGPQMLERFFQTARTMGMSEADFTLTIPHSKDAKIEVEFDRLASELRSRKFMVKRGRLNMSTSQLAPESRIGISLRSGHTESGYNRTFHRILFVISAWVAFTQSTDKTCEAGDTN